MRLYYLTGQTWAEKILREQRFNLSTIEELNDPFFLLMVRLPPRYTQRRSSAASDVYKRPAGDASEAGAEVGVVLRDADRAATPLSLIHISEPTRLGMISYAVFCLKKKN